MKAPEIRIETLFATPLALIEHPYCEALNSSLEELFLSRETIYFTGRSRRSVSYASSC